MQNIYFWLIDYIYLAVGQLQMILFRNPPKDYLQARDNKAPVIILPGIFEKWSFMKTVADKLSAEGHPIYTVPELKYNLQNIPQSAQIVNDLISKLNLSNIILVCHSKGGLIGKYLLINENKKIKKVIAIATPFSGSLSAKLIPSSIYRELKPESKIIQNLSLNRTVNEKIVSIYSKTDNHIWAKNGSFLKNAKNIQTSIWGHHKILFAREVIKEVLKEAN